MSFTPKLHKKLKAPKHATVSLDSLLGLLSSAYGIQQLDSDVVFNKNAVNWKNLSVENLKSVVKKGDSGDQQVEPGKVDVTTSTTGLRRNKGSGSEMDVTLVSIKSLEKIKQFRPEANEAQTEVNKQSKYHEATENMSIESASVDQTVHKAGDKIVTGDYGEIESTIEQAQPIICGFYVDDSNQKVIFDIHFTKKIIRNEIVPDFDIIEPEISINVTDVSKGTKARVGLAKSCLISKFNYFADVDKEYGLENLDVAVECNLNVLQWIIQWAKADIPMCKPNLNVSNLKLVLSMAYHLGIDELTGVCLDYFHLNCKAVLETESDIEDVLDDVLLDKFIKWFTNSEVNEIKDDFASFRRKLFWSLIKLLVDPVPCKAVGHHFSLATIFQCGNCGKLLHQKMTDSVPCRSDCMQLDHKGELTPHHERSPSWDLSRYIELMIQELGHWELVYWKLWGMCHFLYCVECRDLYPLSQSNWCPYHATEAEYFPMCPNVFYPIGMYQCCGEKAFRFNVLEPSKGCKFKSHTPQLDSEDKVRMFEIFQKHEFLVSTQPVEQSGAKRFVRLIKSSAEDLSVENKSSSFWWQGICLAPKEKKDYSIISQDILNRLRNKPLANKCLQATHKPLTFESQIHFGIMPSSTTSVAVEKSVSEHETSMVRCKKNKVKLSIRKVKSSNMFSSSGVKMKKKKSSFSYEPTESVWTTSETVKDNQDNQRDFEEIAMRSLVKMLTPPPQGFTAEPAAGTYIRLEAQWWQAHYGDSKHVKNSGTVVNRAFPLSWFRRLAL